MTTWKGTTWTDAGQILELMDPDADTSAANGESLPAWYARLVAEGDLRDAVQFIAHALPRYECVVWATQTLLEAGSIQRTDPMTVAVLRWIDDPSDGPRRAAGEMAEQASRMGVPQMLGQAVFFSGGSLAPPDYPAVQPPPQVCAKVAYGAVLFGAIGSPDFDSVLRHAMSLGESMLAGPSR